MEQLRTAREAQRGAGDLAAVKVKVVGRDDPELIADGSERLGQRLGKDDQVPLQRQVDIGTLPIVVGNHQRQLPLLQAAVDGAPTAHTPHNRDAMGSAVVDIDLAQGSAVAQ